MRWPVDDAGLTSRQRELFEIIRAGASQRDYGRLMTGRASPSDVCGILRRLQSKRWVVRVRRGQWKVIEHDERL